MIGRLACCLVFLAAPALAEDGMRARGVMRATAFDALPAGVAIAVRPPDATRESADLAGIFVETLARLGHRPDPGAALQLSFRIGDAPGIAVARPPDLELRGSLGAEGHDDAELVMRMQMLDRADSPRPTRTRLIVVELADRGGKSVWEARIEASGAADDVALAEALIPHVLARLGEAAYDLPIPGADR